MTKGPSQSGFTLFEVMVAVSIFALISAMTMTNLIQIGKSGERISESQRQLADIQFALGYVAKDLAQRINRGVRDQYGDQQPALLIEDARLVFTRSGWSNLLQQPRSNLQRVEYRLVDDSLLRKYWPQLDQGYEEQALEQNLISGVEEFRVVLLTSGQETLDRWPVDIQTPSTVKPIALELTLQLQDFGLIRRVYEINNVET